MLLPLCLLVHTSNILGIFNDPFEFEGDYGNEINPTREKVFELVVSKEALSKNLTDSQIKNLMGNMHANEEEIKAYREFRVSEATRLEREYGPTLSEVVTQELIQEIEKKQIELQESGFTKQELDNILHFVEKYKDQKIFHFLRNNPSDLLGLDLFLKQKASQEGKSFDLPLLSSARTLEGQNGFELKKNLLDAVFTKETFDLATPKEKVRKSLEKLKPNYLESFFGKGASNQDIEAFSSPAGQTFFFWMYHALNLHLLSQKPGLIEEINRVKDLFVKTLGNSESRANAFREKFIEADSGVVFTQESDALFARKLTDDRFFLPVDKQNPNDGAFVFMRSDLWEPDYAMISLDEYEKFDEGCINAVLATLKETGQKFILASCHGHSTQPEDGRLQIKLLMKKFYELKIIYPDLQIIIGMDANTKSKDDVEQFKKVLDENGLIATNVGPTTIKKRMVTVQHGKAGRFAIDEEDYVITLSPHRGGHFQIGTTTVGFKEGKADTNTPLPNILNQSDHYTVGAELIRAKN